MSLLPALVLMLRPKSTGQASLLWLAYVLVPCGGLAIACYLATVANDPFGIAGPLSGAIATAGVTFAIALGFPLLVVRLAGWRLVFPGDRCAALRELEQPQSAAGAPIDSSIGGLPAAPPGSVGQHEQVHARELE